MLAIEEIAERCLRQQLHDGRPLAVNVACRCLKLQHRLDDRRRADEKTLGEHSVIDVPRRARRCRRGRERPERRLVHRARKDAAGGTKVDEESCDRPTKRQIFLQSIA